MAKVFAFGLIVTLSLNGSTCTIHRWDRARIAAMEALFLSTNPERQVAPYNLGLSVGNNLLSIAGQRGARLEIRHTPESTPNFSDPESRYQQENGGTNRISASEGTAEQGTEMSRMSKTIAIRYVSDAGSDANDGLSWSTSKRTIYGGLVSLPGGDTGMAGIGTIYVGPGVTASPTANGGIWLMGPNDPNYSSPPAGWLKCAGSGCNVNIIGMSNQAGGPNGHKPRVNLVATGGSRDNNHPGIWISSTAQNIYIANLQFATLGRSVVLGECSNNDRTGRCGVQDIVLDNVGGLNAQTTTSGPCTDIVSNVFWVWLRDYGCAGNYNAAGGITADNHAAILIDASLGSGSGLIYINDTNLAGGGIKFKPGSSTGNLYAKNVIMEGDFVHATPPVVWFTGWGANGDATLENIQAADIGAGSMPTIETDNSGNFSGPTIINGPGAAGAATIFNPTANTSNIATSSPLVQRQSGFDNGYVVGKTDVARRIAGIVPARFVNYGYSNPSNWTYTNTSGSQTFTPGLSDPFGGTGAASISSSSATRETLKAGGVSYHPNAGDWIIAGIWAKGLAQTGASFVTGCPGNPSTFYSVTYFNGGMITGDGQWQYIWIAEKVASGSATNICDLVYFSNTLAPTLYGPTLYVIPAGTLSDNEALEFANTMNSVDSSCPVGSLCNVAGHPIVVSSYRTLSNCSSVTSPAKCDTAPAGSFVLGVGSTTSRVNTTAVTPNSQILIIEDSSLGAKLGVLCNKTTGRTYMITDRTPGVSFTVSSSLAPTDHPACLSYQLIN